MLKPARIAIFCLGILAAGSARPAEAPIAAPQVTVTATVDANGKVLVDRAEEPPQRVGDAPSALSMVGRPCPEKAPLEREQARRLVEATAREEQFLPDFVLAVASRESGFVSTHLSPKGAYGLMQLMPATAQAFGVDLCDPVANVRGGIAFLRELTAKYRNPIYVLAAYNAGEPAILKAKGVPAIQETVGYIASVLNEFYRWPTLDRSEAFGPARLDLATGATIATPVADRPRPAAARSETPPWQGGFVQNFD